mmetsp:Transcript_6190/g.13611  ORF Transcript_6190/g.13611 Transcript_6190/m.13611 type:complete len:152 (+) Transcript_6190:649-1104(+)
MSPCKRCVSESATYLTEFGLLLSSIDLGGKLDSGMRSNDPSVTFTYKAVGSLTPIVRRSDSRSNKRRARVKGQYSHFCRNTVTLKWPLRLENGSRGIKHDSSIDRPRDGTAGNVRRSAMATRAWNSATETMATVALLSRMVRIILFLTGRR